MCGCQGERSLGGPIHFYTNGKLILMYVVVMESEIYCDMQWYTFYLGYVIDALAFVF